MPLGPPHPWADLHLEDDADDRQVQGLPRLGGWPLVNLIAHCGHRQPVSGACPAWKLPAEATGSTARRCDLWPRLRVTHLPPGRALACRSTQGQSGSAAPGTAGQRAGETPAPETAGPTEPVRGHPSPSGACRDP